MTADNGTGVVHCAPAFGEDDMRVCLASGAPILGEKLCMLVLCAGEDVYLHGVRWDMARVFFAAGTGTGMTRRPH